jgi:tetratricopeptide (TPR) repeat protein
MKRILLAAMSLTLALPALADDPNQATLTPEQRQGLEDVLKTYGHNQLIETSVTQVLGLTGPGQTLTLRQVSGDDDNDRQHQHYFNQSAADPNVVVFMFYDKTANITYGYRTDAAFRYISGYVSRATLTPLTPQQGVAGLATEIRWWSNAISGHLLSIKGDEAAKKGDYAAAMADYTQAIPYENDPEEEYNSMAWILATCPDPKYRNGTKAVEYATKACQLSSWKNPTQVDTLAAAYAEAGDFDSAIKWENQYLQSPKLSASDTAVAHQRLALYQAHQPYHTGKAGPN